MKTLALFLLSLCVGFSATAQSGTSDTGSKNPVQTGIAVSPAKLSFNLDKGQTAKKTVTINNGTKNKQNLVVQFMDWSRDTMGEHSYYPPGSSQHSCAPWVTFDKPLIELNPGQSTEVVVTMKVPDDPEAVKEMKWTMLVLKAVSDKVIPQKGKILGAQIEQQLGLGVHVYQVPPNITSKELKMISFTELPGKNAYRVVCKNVGGLQLYGKFSLELASSETGAKTALKPQTVPLFPQQDRYVDFIIPATVPKGKYTAVAMIDANDDDVPIEAAQKEIVIK